MADTCSLNEIIERLCQVARRPSVDSDTRAQLITALLKLSAQVYQTFITTRCASYSVYLFLLLIVAIDGLVLESDCCGSGNFQSVPIAQCTATLF